MREIKFRAWADYGDSGEMLPNIQNHINGDWAFGNILANNVDVINFSVMQYTGLNDKNGVEIYEGDIVTKGYQTFGVMNGIVKVINGCWMVTRDNKDDHYWNLHHGLDLAEVVGNIHQNPELINA